jgi:hypothetical protein
MTHSDLNTCGRIAAISCLEVNKSRRGIVGYNARNHYINMFKLHNQTKLLGVQESEGGVDGEMEEDEESQLISELNLK